MNYAREIRGMLKNLGLVRRSNGVGTFLVGAGVGAVAGAAVAILLTPTNGKQMRQLVGSRAKQIASTAEKKISSIKSANGAKEQLHA
jgi:gas vesicle protein